MQSKVTSVDEIHPMINRLLLQGDVEGTIDVYKTYFNVKQGDDILISMGMNDDDYCMNASIVNKTDQHILASAGGLLVKIDNMDDATVKNIGDKFSISMHVIQPETKKSTSKRRKSR